MLFVIVILMLVFGIGCMVYYAKPGWKSEAWALIGITFTIIGAIALICCLITLGVNHLGVDGDIARYEQKYETLTYQYENNLYDNDNDLGKKELLNQIQAWNEDLAWSKVNQKDFWIGIFIPNIYDQFEFIRLEG